MSSLTRPLTTRAIHLRITPRPSNLGESREILRLLSAFGEIEYFKSLRYDVLSAPNAALVIYKDEAAALECLKRSPVRFRMGRVSGRKEEVEKKMDEGEVASGAGAGKPNVEEKEVRRGPVGAPFGLGASTTFTQTQQARSMSTQQHQFAPSRPTQTDNRTPLSSPNPFPLPAQPSSPASSDESQRIFQITTHPSSRHFRDHVNVNHYHGPFAIDTKQFGQADLAKKVPTLGLSCMDWRAVEKPWHVIKVEKERESSGFKRRRRLGEVWEEGMREREEDEGVGVGVGKEKGGQGGAKEEEFGLFGKGWRG
ncbi:hypothetical protein LTR37_011290 [Vermiconidia calcicola]|uniref:Uncharacterized protein n=1 Tax=Vermiconidia calcicola TaxID=1690605 RepID=A0ACC3N2F5_9PEZI|nr:hypothetical protein LTR37_011290 [Vermiconidia calcicola]